MTALTAPAKVKRPLDLCLFGATLALVTFGLLMVMDASYARNLDIGANAYILLKHQVVGAVLGLIGMAAVIKFGYWHLRDHAVPLMLINLVLLAAVYVPRLGAVENGAARWLRYPIQFQPSELAKLALLLYLAALLSRKEYKIENLKRGLGPPLFVSFCCLALIEHEPDLGTAVVLFLAVITQMFLAGARTRHILSIVVCACVLMICVTYVFKHRTGRIEAWMHPEQHRQGIGYQVYHARLAVGSGEVFGVGIGHGREKFFLPQGESDFIFATIAEEIGFIGVLAVLAVLFLVGWRGFRIAGQSSDRFGQLLAIGIAALISWQALVNIAVATGAIPATGVPLPFISYGSTSLIVTLVEIGILLSISQHPTPPAMRRVR